MLFRKGFLTIVVATGTLALGINMPCKTVVFTKESVFLNALNYRQASGRSGRRGFDLLGNVVFHGFDPIRAFELVSSALPDLRGQFPISTTLVLRLFTLLHGTGQSGYSKRIVDSLLSQARLYLGGPTGSMAIKHHVRFSIEYLRRQHLLSADGAPLGFSGLVGHLYFTENAVFAFHALLKAGYFHRVCASLHRNREGVLVKLMLVLCHIFCRIPCPAKKDVGWLERVHSSPSVVMLPQLPQKARNVLEEHNRKVLGIFTTYVRTFVDQHLSNQPDEKLPFTGCEVGSKISEKDLGSTLSAISGVVTPPKIRSPFSALSGFTDTFGSIHELCSTVRHGVFLEETAVPYVTVEDPNGAPWNAYAFDFFRHGDLRALVRDNGIHAGDVWFRLKDFSLVLRAIETSLYNLKNSDTVVDEGVVGEGIEDEDAVGVDIEDKDVEAKESDVKGDSELEAFSEYEDDQEAGLDMVCEAFQALCNEFDGKFRRTWA